MYCLPPFVSPRRRIYLICERLHVRLVLKCPNSSPERCDGACKHLRPQSAWTINRLPGVPSQGRIVPFPPFQSDLKASITRVQRLTQVEVTKLCSDQNRSTAVLIAASSRLTLQHSVFPHSFGIQGLTAAKVWYAKCLSIMRKEERHAEDFRR